MDARNLCKFVTSMNKYLENKSIRVPLQTNHHGFRKSPELKIAETQESTWQKYHIFLLCSCSSLILFFQQVSVGHTDVQWYSSWSNNVLNTLGFSPATWTLHAIYCLPHWPWSCCFCHPCHPSAWWGAN